MLTTIIHNKAYIYTRYDFLCPSAYTGVPILLCLEVYLKVDKEITIHYQRSPKSGAGFRRSGKKVPPNQKRHDHFPSSNGRKVWHCRQHRGLLIRIHQG